MTTVKSFITLGPTDESIGPAIHKCCVIQDPVAIALSQLHASKKLYLNQGTLTEWENAVQLTSMY
jgi:hypothetical protein